MSNEGKLRNALGVYANDDDPVYSFPKGERGALAREVLALSPTPEVENPCTHNYGALGVGCMPWCKTIEALTKENLSLRDEKASLIGEVAVLNAVKNQRDKMEYELTSLSSSLHILKGAMEKIAKNASSTMSFEMIECEAQTALDTINQTTSTKKVE